MVMGVVIALSLLLTIACVLIHYEVLRLCNELVPRLTMATRAKVLFVVGGVMFAHYIEIWLFAGAFALVYPYPQIGRIIGDFDESVMDFFYLSITNYTTLGVGDVLPHGPLRILAGVQGLVGFVLVGWSASFIYLAMEKFWGEHRPKKGRDG